MVRFQSQSPFILQALPDVDTVPPGGSAPLEALPADKAVGACELEMIPAGCVLEGMCRAVGKDESHEGMCGEGRTAVMACIASPDVSGVGECQSVFWWSRGGPHLGGNRCGHREATLGQHR